MQYSHRFRRRLKPTTAPLTPVRAVRPVAIAAPAPADATADRRETPSTTAVDETKRDH
jgi:hypothetical protein